MATAGRVYTGYMTDSRFYVDWKQTDQSTDGNYTDISYTIGINNGDWWYTNALKIYSVVIDGSTVLSNKTYSNITTQGDVVLATGTKRIYHSDNGSKTLSISISGWGYEDGNVSGSDSWALTTIARKTEVSLSTTSVYFGNNITINCAKKSSSFTNKLYYKINSGSWVTISANAGNSYTFNVAMSLIAEIPNDMSCTFTIECDTYNGTSLVGSSSKTFTATVPSSARTAPSLNKTTISLRDESVTITLDPYAGTWQHIVAYSIGNISGYIQQTKTTAKSFTFTPQIDLAKQILLSDKGNVSITVYTYNGSGTLVGSTSSNLEVIIPEDIVPVINNIEVAEAVQNVEKTFDGFVQNLSQLLISISAAGTLDSSITTTKTTVNGISYLGTEFTSQVVTSSGEVIISSVVTDSRGRTSEAFETKVQIIEYTYPSLEMTVDIQNGKVVIGFIGEISPVENKNTKTLFLYYKSAQDEDYIKELIPIDSWNFEFNIERNIDATESTYEFKAELLDKIDIKTVTVMTGKVILSRRAGGTGITFGGEAEEDGLVSNWETKLNKGLLVNGIDHTITPEEYAELEALIASISV